MTKLKLISRENGGESPLEPELIRAAIRLDQYTLSDWYHNFDIACLCTTPPTLMHIKHRSGDKPLYWIADNPSMHPHHESCPFYSKKGAVMNGDEWAIESNISFGGITSKPNSNSASPRRTSADLGLKKRHSKLHRIICNAYESSFSGYYFGSRHDVIVVGKKIQESDFSQDLHIDGWPFKAVLFYGNRGLVYARAALSSQQGGTSVIWLDVADTAELDNGWLKLDASRFYPASKHASKELSSSTGPFLVVTVWNVRDGAHLVTRCLTLPIVSKNVCIPVASESEREILNCCAETIKANRHLYKRLFFHKPLISVGEGHAGAILVHQKATESKQTIKELNSLDAALLN